jgi:guanylate kinase
VSIFVLPPSPQVLEMRLRNRSQAEHMTAEDVIGRRLSEAREELKRIWVYRYALVNDVLDQAVTELRAIVVAEREMQVIEAEPEDGQALVIAGGCRTDHPSERLTRALETFS